MNLEEAMKRGKLNQQLAKEHEVLRAPATAVSYTNTDTMIRVGTK